jgi:hypothetical protein
LSLPDYYEALMGVRREEALPFYQQIKKEVKARNVEEVYLDDLVLFRPAKGCEWNEANQRCNGLIVHWPTQKIVGRPANVTFELNELPGCCHADIRKKAQSVQHWAVDQPDGKTVTIFCYDDIWQAATARRLVWPHVGPVNLRIVKSQYNLAKGYTYICEFIRDELILLDVCENLWIPSLCDHIELENIAKHAGMKCAKSVGVGADPTKSPIPSGSRGYTLVFEDAHRVFIPRTNV